MNNKFSDSDKVILATWPIFGAGIGVFVAPLFGTNFIIAGIIGLLAGATVDYVLFFEPWKRQYGLFSYPEAEDVSTQDEAETDPSEFIEDSFELEGVISQTEIELGHDEDEKANSADENDSESTEMEDDGEIDCEEVEEVDADSLSESGEDDSNEIDASDEESEVGESEDNDLNNLPSDNEDSKTDNFHDEDDGEEIDEVEEQGTDAAYYIGRNEIHSAYKGEFETEEPQGFKAWITPTQLPLTLAGVWFIVSGYISSNDPEFAKIITGYFPASFFILLPIFFLIGLSGFVGILTREQDASLEVSTRENARFLINLLKIFTGWGLGIYALLVNL